MRNDNVKPNKSQTPNKEQNKAVSEWKLCTAFLFPKKSVGANRVRVPLFVNTTSW